jgi:hypothetical protein
MPAAVYRVVKMISKKSDINLPLANDTNPGKPEQIRAVRGGNPLPD